MQSNMTYLASAAIAQHDLLTLDTSATSATALCCKPASSDDVIIGRANSAAAVGEPVNLGEISVGSTFTCIAGGSISAGDFLAASSGKAVKGATELMAIEGASSGDKFRAVLVEQEIEEPEPPEPVEPFDPLTMVPTYNQSSGYKPTLAVGDLIELGWNDQLSPVYPGQEITGDKVHVIYYNTKSLTIASNAENVVVLVDGGSQYDEHYKFKVIRGGPERTSGSDPVTPILCMVSAIPAST